MPELQKMVLQEPFYARTVKGSAPGASVYARIVKKGVLREPFMPEPVENGCSGNPFISKL